MNEPAAYLTDVELALIASPFIADYQIIRSWANTDDGYIRIRARLTNDDFIEAAEYFAARGEKLITVDYRYHWTNYTKQVLRRRWDSTPDHPELENFPYHVHVGNEETVIPGEPLGLIAWLKIVEDELT